MIALSKFATHKQLKTTKKTIKKYQNKPFTTTKQNSFNHTIQKKSHMITRDKITNVRGGVWGNAYISAQVILRMTCECFDIF
jgi:hypothetical protein